MVLSEEIEASSAISLGKRREQRDPFLFEMPLTETHLKEEAPASSAPAAELVRLVSLHTDLVT